MYIFTIISRWLIIVNFNIIPLSYVMVSPYIIEVAVVMLYFLLPDNRPIGVFNCQKKHTVFLTRGIGGNHFARSGDMVCGTT